MSIKKNMPCYYFHLFIAILCIQATSFVLTAMESKLIFNEASLEDVAVSQGYGYKYANLRELEKLSAEVNQEKTSEAYTIAVPVFAGISSQDIQEFLKKNDFDVAAQWAKIIEQHFGSERSNKARLKALKDHRYPDDFLKDQETFKKELDDKFGEIIKNIKESSLDKVFGVSGIDELIGKVKESSERLMVRSTGKEDTKKLANAGGNESKSNVKPELLDVMNAMREVVISYFDQKSLKQRLGADDASVFDPVPFTPELIQRMIGEKPGVIPKCGVMFTEEAEGGISRYEKIDETTGRMKTTGITIIQSAYGHNEGVVNSLIPVDTYYLDGNKSIYPVIRPKTVRMVPDPNNPRSLIMVKNDESVINVHKSSLNKEALITLKKFADRLEEYYKGPMDVEFVVNEAEKIIYIVQARPIVHRQGLKKASYIAEPEKINQENFITGQSIGVAGGSLRFCIDKAQLIVAKDIGQALSIYQDKEKTPDTNNIECIIVGKMAPATSHEATTFRSEGKPVVCIEQYQMVQNWLKGIIKIVVSPQQGLVIKWPGDETSVQALIDNKIGVEGWINYPIPERISLSPEFAPIIEGSSFDQIITSMLPKGRTFESFLKKPEQKIELEGFIMKLKKGSLEQAEVALGDILFTLRIMIKQAHGRAEKLDESYQRRIAMLMKYTIYCAKQVKKNLDANPMDTLNYPRRLFAIRFLESVLFQTPKLGEIEDGMISAKRVLIGLAEEREMYAKLRDREIKPTPTMVKLMRFGSLAMTDDLRESWENFIIGLAKSGDQKIMNEFRQMILVLGQMDVMPVWLHTSFDQASRKKVSALDVAQALMDEFEFEDKFIGLLQEKLALMKSFNISVFDTPKNFENSWRIFNESFLSWFLSDGFLQKFKSAKRLGKLIAAGIMAKFVNEVFDLSIKAVTGSQQYVVEDKLKRFHSMLIKYLELFRQWITLVPEGAINYGGRQVFELRKVPALSYIDIVDDQVRELSALSYVDIVDKILKKETSSGQDLKLTPGFNVSAFTIGSGMDLEYSKIIQPKTSEDAFTIAHQCLVVIVSVLGSEAGIKNIVLPLHLKAITAEFKQEIGAVLVSISLSQGSISLFYNKVLRDHSVQFEFFYEKKPNQIMLEINFFGDDPYGRWDNIAQFTFLSGIAGLITTNEIELSSSGVTLEIPITKETKYNKLWESIRVLIAVSYNFGDDYKPLDYGEIERSLIKKPEDFLVVLEALKKQFGRSSILKNAWACSQWKKLLETFKKMVEEGNSTISEVAMSTASDALELNTANDKGINQSANRLISALLDQGQVFDQAIALAEKFIKSRERLLTMYGFNIFLQLFKIEKAMLPALKKAVPVTLDAMNSDPEQKKVRWQSVLKECLLRLSDLVKEGKEFELASNVYSTVEKSQNSVIKDAATVLKKDLEQSKSLFLDLK